MTPTSWPVWRSLLYVPADRPSFLARAGERGADAVILDLEDAVAPGAKDTARSNVADAADAIAAGGCDVLVRVNRDDGLLAEDLGAAVREAVTATVLPKCDDPQLVVDVARTLERREQDAGLAVGHTRLFVRIEDPRGLQRCHEILRASDRIVATALGLADLTAAMEWTGEDPVVAATTTLFVAARASGVMPLGLTTTIDEHRDLERLRRQAERARSLGSRGSPCIHPAQVPVLNDAFTPSDDEVEWAGAVVVAWRDKQSQGVGAVELDGQFVDRAVARRAHDILSRVEH